MLYFNSNGHESTMCGNGGRCVWHLPNNLGVIGSNTVFKAIDGVHKAKKIIKHNITLQMTDVLDIKRKE